MLTELNAISPIDGRYRSKTAALSAYFSEEALIRAREREVNRRLAALRDMPAHALPARHLEAS